MRTHKLQDSYSEWHVSKPMLDVAPSAYSRALRLITDYMACHPPPPRLLGRDSESGVGVRLPLQVSGGIRPADERGGEAGAGMRPAAL